MLCVALAISVRAFIFSKASCSKLSATREDTIAEAVHTRRSSSRRRSPKSVCRACAFMRVSPKSNPLAQCKSAALRAAQGIARRSSTQNNNNPATPHVACGKMALSLTLGAANATRHKADPPDAAPEVAPVVPQDALNRQRRPQCSRPQLREWLNR